MILVTGGRAQGKKAFVETRLRSGETVSWTDGAAAGMEEMEAAECCCNFQEFMRRVFSGEVQAGADLAQRLALSCPDRVIVTDEIGCGIVPLSGDERYWREETGRICCRLAAMSGQVWRVTCGIGVRIK